MLVSKYYKTLVCVLNCSVVSDSVRPIMKAIFFSASFTTSLSLSSIITDFYSALSGSYIHLIYWRTKRGDCFRSALRVMLGLVT